MSKEEKAQQTKEATHAGAEEGATPETKDDATNERTFSQADLDRAVTEASKAIHAKVEAQYQAQNEEAQRKILEEAGKYEDLYRNTAEKLEALETQNARAQYENEARGYLASVGMSAHADALIEGTTSIDALKGRAEAFKASVDKAVEAAVQDRLNTGPPKVPKNTTPKEPVAITDMTDEQYQAWKESEGLRR